MPSPDRTELLKQQLTIFAQELNERDTALNELRSEVYDAIAMNRAQLAELRDIYQMHKRHLQETISLTQPVLQLFHDLDVHLGAGHITFTAPAANRWHRAFRLAAKKAGATLLQQKEELAPYLKDDWKPPHEKSWEGKLARVSEPTDNTTADRTAPLPAHSDGESTSR